MNCLPKTMFNDVAEFQFKVLGNCAPNKPVMLSRGDTEYAVKCVMEEILELQEAYDKQDIAGVADAIADGIYFFMGLAYKMGLPFEDVWAIVHSSNMQKQKGMTKRGDPNDAAKPKGWVDPKNAIREALCQRAQQ